MSLNSVILSLHYGGHDTSAALMVDGELVAACEQERYTGDKHSRRFPSDAVADCLAIAGLTMADVTRLALGWDGRRWLRETYLRPALTSDDRLDFLLGDLDRIAETARLEAICRERLGYDGPVSVYRHHLCHVASAYYPSGFDDALLVSYDGMGEVDTGMIAAGRGGRIEILHDETWYPDSLGLFYSAMTYYLGWQHHCDEGIIMGLAPYGDASATVPGRSETYAELMRDVVRETGDYTYEINRDWIAYHRERDTWVSERFLETFGPKRDYADPLTDHHRNLAAALQGRLEEVVLGQLARAREQFGLARLGVSGGVGLNCSLNGRIVASGLFDEVFVQPASGDAGIPVGACYLAYAEEQGGTLAPRRRNDFYLGSRFASADVNAALEAAGEALADAVIERPDDVFAETAEHLAEGRIVAWFTGGAEFGPRALGHRSILTRPYPAEMKDVLNRRVKFREDFRPFAPAVLAEHTGEYFALEQPSPHMLIAVQARAERRDAIPAVVHVDNSCRVQTVAEDGPPRFRRLLEAFYERTGVPVLLNTSFNVKGQPIVNTPAEAVACFLGTNIDVLVMEDVVVRKAFAAEPVALGEAHDERVC